MSLLVRRTLGAAGLLIVCGLATAGSAWGQTAVATPSRKDPYESVNRRIFAFNQAVDDAVLKPVAQGYQRVVPELVRVGIDNVLGNVGDVWSAVNQLLQGKVANSATMTLRVLSNTAFGLGGLFDPATLMGLERQSEDLGQTLGTWGVPSGPYLMLPLLGSSTVRDAVATPVDRYFGPSTLPETLAGSLGVAGLQLVSVRAGLLGASAMLDGIALDKYSFLRDAYLARRRNQVYDGDPPEERDDAELAALAEDADEEATAREAVAGAIAVSASSGAPGEPGQPVKSP